MKILLRVFPLFLLLFSSFSFSHKPLKILENKHYAVKRVIDGDTFVIDNHSSKGIKVRFIGIDAPESRNTGRKTVGYFGMEAKKYLTNRLHGKQVTLTFDIAKKDRYGRVLAYVYLDEVFLNAELVERGYAVSATFPPNVRYAEYFVGLESKARKQGVGLWK